ncbi:hypothetical protein BJ322DRAFT_1107230 [Thelephora terrestris]|uniref:Uncharacterized protein n=1 Tax=Thelephora terrestris TaxID=56493 RepID=A0A9P6L8G7_9AGAM|nr:hypothetical protein BJ322DRAFT_1107230 [Thelephora terrestris]
MGRFTEKFDESYDFSNVALFPWTSNSLDTLWDGEYANKQADEWTQWESVVGDLYGTIAAVGNHKLHVKTHKYKYSVDLPEQKTYRPNDFSCAWALMNPSQALLLFNDGSVLHILDPVLRNFVGSLAGHGGHITSIVVHPRLPHLFCTTARDFTTRIYDLTQRARQRPHNPIWPPRKSAPKAGAAAGIHASSPEGNGPGLCTIILAGGRSGGHQAAVMCAAFHPTLPLIATGGMDRFVKIWKLPLHKEMPTANNPSDRLDKPVFASSHIHQARVLSVTWVSDDVLITHCASWLGHVNDDTRRPEFREFPGTLTLWKWLGLRRFFPEGKEIQENSRGCAADYQESSSFKLISEYRIPMETSEVRISHGHGQDPLVLLSTDTTTRIMNVTHFKPRIPQPFFIKDLDDLHKKRADARQREFELNSKKARNKGLTIDDYPERAPEPPMREVRNIEEVPRWTIYTTHTVGASALMVGARRLVTVGPHSISIWTR